MEDNDDSLSVDKLLEDSDSINFGEIISQHRQRLHHRLRGTLTGTSVVLNIILTLTIAFLWLRRDISYFRNSVTYSPIWDEVTTAYQEVRFDGVLDAGSKWRGSPSPAVDAAWAELDDVGSIVVDEATFFRAGGTADNLKMPDDLGGQLIQIMAVDRDTNRFVLGGGYMADIEMMHQMHCLNFMRMAIHADYYRDKAPEWRDSNHTFDTHLEHCIEMIRINLLCNADAGIIPFKWVENYQRPLPDFSTTHKCRDWEGVLGWARKKEIFVPADYRWARGANEKVFPRPAWMLAESIHH